MGEGAVEDETVKATTGANLVSGNASSAIRDFLPKVAGAVLQPGIENDRTGFALHFNKRILWTTAQLGIELNKPTLYAPLIDSIPPAVRDATNDRLTKSLNDQDDFTGAISFNWENNHFGRAFGPHRYLLGQLVAAIATAGGMNEGLALGALNELNFSGKVLPSRRSDPECTAGGNSAHTTLGCYSHAFADSVRNALRAEARALLARRQMRRDAMAEAGLDIVSALLNNQPQANLSLSYRYRDPLVGPKEFKASGRYERGGRNLNWATAKCAELAAKCFAPLAKDPLTREGLSRAARGWVQVDFVFRPAHELTLPEPRVILSEQRSSETNLTVGYGQYFGELAEGLTRPRVDVDGSYNRQLNGTARTNRAVAKIAFTVPLSDGITGVVGAAWANKPEFLGQVDRALSATLGLTYKLLQPATDK